MKQREELASKINTLLTQYAKRRENGDYIGPDAYCMEKAMLLLKDASVEIKYITAPNSEVQSGCYKRSSDTLHEEIMSEFDQLLKKECSKCGKSIEVSFSFCPYCQHKQ